jgi:Carboxypeptidase regulatory-like domain
MQCIKRNSLRAAILIAMVVAGASQVKAQTLYGSIVGTVTDGTGAVVPDAMVKAIQTSTDETRTATTNSDGIYTLSTLPAGAYDVSITKAGFGVFESKGVILTINTTARVDAKLAVGSQTQTVSVSSSTAELQTDRVDVHGEVSADQLQQLPQPTRTSALQAAEAQTTLPAP